MGASDRTWEHDVFLSYNRRDGAAVERLAKALCERDLRVFKDDWYLQPGDFWPTALERKLHRSAAILVVIGRHGLGPWQQREVVAALDCQDQARNSGESTPLLLPLLLEQGADKHAGLNFLMQNVWVEAWDPRAADLIKCAIANTPPIELYDQGHPDPRGSICPYRGLQVFREEDAAFYFGREPDVAALAEAVERHPVAAVVGPSGSGKSSLVRAGLFPRLRQATCEHVWQLIAMMPGRNPFRALADQLLPLREPERYLGWSKADIDDECDRLTARLERDGAEHLARVVGQILEEEPGTTRLLLLVDQWEELYTEIARTSITQINHAELRRRFVDMLLATVREVPLQLVLTIRADCWGEVLNDASLMQSLAKNEAVIHLTTLHREALATSICKPAEQVGLEVPDALTESLLNDADGQPGDLPLLEFVLQRLWAESLQTKSAALSLTAYDAMGGLGDAIVKHADKQLDRLNQSEREAVPGLFAALVQVDEQRSDLRRRAPFAQLNATAQAVAHRFADARLLVTSRDLESGEDLVEVAHEALLRHWPRLEEWITTRRDSLLTIRQLEADCRVWLTKDRHPDYLWSHERAREASAAIAQLGEERVLGADEREFLGPIDPVAMLAELKRPKTTHRRRLLIGERLDIFGDPREGVGLTADGLPDLDWRQVTGGEVSVEIHSIPDDVHSPLKEALGQERQTFFMSRFPITATQYRAFLEAADGWRDPACWADDLFRSPEGTSYDFGRFGNHPAVYVSWFDAMAFCRWLSRRLDRQISLPDEWQWQLAASGGDPSRAYPWGTDWDAKSECHRANTIESRLGRSTAVGMYPAGASPADVLDMGGTIWEWCLNKFAAPETTISVADDFDVRVFRGGSWFVRQDYTRCAARFCFVPNLRSRSVGFRVVCSSPLL